MCLAALSVEDIEDIYLFRTMITGILLIGSGFALGYRRIQKNGNSCSKPHKAARMIEAVGRAVSIETIIAIWILSRRSSRLYKGKMIIWRPKWTERVACKIGMCLLAPKTKQSYLFLAPLGSGLGKAVVAIYLRSVGLSGGSDQRRIRGCGPDGCLLGRIHFPCGYVMVYVLLCC